MEFNVDLAHKESARIPAVAQFWCHAGAPGVMYVRISDQGGQSACNDDDVFARAHFYSMRMHDGDIVRTCRRTRKKIVLLKWADGPPRLIPDMD